MAWQKDRERILRLFIDTNITRSILTPYPINIAPLRVLVSGLIKILLSIVEGVESTAASCIKRNFNVDTA
jgi:hypothetical protein